MRALGPALLLVAITTAACGGEEELTPTTEVPATAPHPSATPTATPSLAPTPTRSSSPTPTPSPSEVTPGRTSFEQCLGEPSDPAACTEDLPAPGEG